MSLEFYFSSLFCHVTAKLWLASCNWWSTQRKPPPDPKSLLTFSRPRWGPNSGGGERYLAVTGNGLDHTAIRTGPYRWTWIWRTLWYRENWSVICKICRIHMTNTWYASDCDQAYRPSYAKIRRSVVRHIQVHLYFTGKYLSEQTIHLLFT